MKLGTEVRLWKRGKATFSISLVVIVIGGGFRVSGLG